ncbi:MAG: SPOR domain-containing protein [Pseudomonadota bacterium]
MTQSNVPNVVVHTQSFRAIMDSLSMLQSAKRYLACIVAPIGTGKTTLAQLLFANRHDIWPSKSIFFFSADACLDSEGQQHWQAAISVSDALTHWCRSSWSETADCVLLIDDAETLTDAATSSLLESLELNVQKNDTAPLVVLCAEPEYWQRLHTTNFVGWIENHACMMQLHSMKYAEAKEFIHKYLAAGSGKNVQLSFLTLYRIFIQAQGNGGRLRDFADQWLARSHKSIQKREIVSMKKIPAYHLISIALVAVGIIALWVWGDQSKFTPSLHAASGNVPTTDVEKNVAAIDPATQEDFKVNTTPTVRFVDVPETESPFQENTETDETNVSQNSDNKEQDQIIDTAKTTNDKSISLFEKARPADEKVNSDSEKAAITGEVSALITAAESEKVQNNVVENSESKTIKTKVEIPQVTAAQKAGIEEFKREQWVRSLSPEKYTLQVLGGRDEKAIQDFIRSHKELDELAYYQTELNKSEWYVVIHGEYASRDQAKAAVAQLPRDVQSKDPWARSIDELQRTIQ